MIDRRTFIVALVAAYGCGQKEEPKTAAETPKSAATIPEAQQAGAVRRIGILTGGVVANSVSSDFFDGLRELGWVEGQNLLIERRGADGNSERAPALAAELVQLRPDVIVTFGAVAGVAARDATTTIPLVATTGDPVRLGLVSNLAHPGGNITGFSLIAPELAAKRLELLREILVVHGRFARVCGRAVEGDLGLALGLLAARNYGE